jgi:hypothetical protein
MLLNPPSPAVLSSLRPLLPLTPPSPAVLSSLRPLLPLTPPSPVALFLLRPLLPLTPPHPLQNKNREGERGPEIEEGSNLEEMEVGRVLIQSTSLNHAIDMNREYTVFFPLC